jgi:porphobilinogen synthase
MNHQPLKRPRRNRRSPSIRSLVCQNRVELHDLIAPLFVKEDANSPEPIDSLPGIFRYSPQALIGEADRLYQQGIQAIALFPCQSPHSKNAQGTEALNPNNLINRSIQLLKQQIPQLTVIADVALDPYTSHGHDGILDAQGKVANDPTVEILCQMAVLQAAAGVDYVAPSDMMDGRVRAIRHALDQAGHTETGIMAYSAKFASAYYGPFRDAVGSQKAAGQTYLDKKTYQLDPANGREAIEEALLDEEEGADILMVKPAGLYLDILHALRQETKRPLAAYQVSGEYAQIHAAAQRGWLDLRLARDESLLAIKRAGADMIITYFAASLAEEKSRSTHHPSS